MPQYAIMTVPVVPLTHLTECIVVSSALTTSLPVRKTASDPGPNAKHCLATGRDCNNNTIYPFSCIDDVILPNDLATQCPPYHTCELGYLSDHIPLLMTHSTSTLKIHIPIHIIFHPPNPQNPAPIKF